MHRYVSVNVIFCLHYFTSGLYMVDDLVYLILSSFKQLRLGSRSTATGGYSVCFSRNMVRMMGLLSVSVVPLRNGVQAWGRGCTTIPAAFRYSNVSALSKCSTLKRINPMGLNQCIYTLARLLSSSPPRGFEKFFPKSEDTPGVNKSSEETGGMTDGLYPVSLLAHC
ncbi:unnamed protein product [Oncorhynchus mykiss]|uniref:Uncharacterized protein n=1 Tax=Oncorhynchus mykiss TaxID=8022 RepID=A0A060WWE6_ONCMY|nr:unnamed protein product [Oncorhynchus mykiss]